MNTLIRLLILVVVVSVAMWLIAFLPLSGMMHEILVVIVAVIALCWLLEGFNGFSWRGGPPVP